MNTQKTIEKPPAIMPNVINEVNQEPTVNVQEEFHLLKSTIVNQENLELIKEKLKITSTYRSRLFTDRNINLLEQFPFFFTNPELVSRYY